MVTIRTVSDRSVRQRLSQQAYVRKMKQVQAGAVATSDMGKKTASFWLMENLSATFLKCAPPGESLRSAQLPIEIRPISHCGMGIAAVEVAEFQSSRLVEVIEAFSDPEYHLFAYEGAGAMLALFERDFFLLGSKAFALMGLLPLASLRQPDKERFVSFFDPEIRRLIAHGYGRMLYFKNHGIGGAIRQAGEARFLEERSCIQGIAFAYSMVNNSDLGRVFQAGSYLKTTPAGAGFQDGLIYALEFWEWMAPGFLLGLKARNDYESLVIRTAEKEIERCRAEGPLAPFAVKRSCFRRLE